MASKGWISYPVTNSPQHLCNNCTRVFELYENLGYSTSTVKGYGRQCSWGVNEDMLYVDVPDLVYCSFQKIFDNSESVTAFNSSLLGKNIEILLIFIKPLQCSRQCKESLGLNFDETYDKTTVESPKICQPSKHLFAILLIQFNYILIYKYYICKAFRKMLRTLSNHVET